MKREFRAVCRSLMILALWAPSGHAKGPDPRAQAEHLLEALGQKPETQRLAAAPVAKSRDALARARAARQRGEQAHGAELERLALIWAELARDLLRTAEVESKLLKLQKESAELDVKALRTRALIEQTVARRGRAELKLKSIEVGHGASESAAPATRPASEPKPAPSPAAPRPEHGAQ